MPLKKLYNLTFFFLIALTLISPEGFAQILEQQSIDYLKNPKPTENLSSDEIRKIERLVKEKMRPAIKELFPDLDESLKENELRVDYLRTTYDGDHSNQLIFACSPKDQKLKFLIRIYCSSNKSALYQYVKNRLDDIERIYKGPAAQPCGYEGRFHSYFYTEEGMYFVPRSNMLVEVSYKRINDNKNSFIESNLNKVCQTFEQHGVHNLLPWLISNPGNPNTELTPEPEEDNREPFTTRLTLTDTDHEFTLADRAQLTLEVTNNSQKDYFNLSVVFEITPEWQNENDPVIWLPDEPFSTSGYEDISLGRGQTKRINLTIRSIGMGSNKPILDLSYKSKIDQNSWAFENLNRDGLVDAHKPKPEKKIPLENILSIKLADNGSLDNTILYQKKLDAMDVSGNVQTISYPDFSSVVSLPNASPASIEYYLKGDVLNSSPGNEWIRALAVRAARYGKHWDGYSVPTHDPEIPDDPEKVVENVAWFVYNALMPKKAPDEIFFDTENARGLWNNAIGFNSNNFIVPSKKGFICQEHALLFGSLLRALGFPVRDLNFQSQPFFAKSIVYVIKEGDARNWQDAGSEVYYNGQWNYWGLFNVYVDEFGEGPIRDHLAFYNKWFEAYELWEGTRILNESNHGNVESRFNIGSKVRIYPTAQWWWSGVWKMRGIGAAGRFTEPPAPLVASGFVAPYPGYVVTSELGWIKDALFKGGEYIVDKVYSPVNMHITYPDGKTIGVKGAFPIEGNASPGATPDFSGYENDIPHSYYYPEGTTFYADHSDESTYSVLPQTIVTRIRPGQGIPERTLRLTGTGEGPYTLRTFHLTKEGVQKFMAINGNISHNEVHQYTKNDLKPDGLLVPFEEIPNLVIKDEQVFPGTKQPSVKPSQAIQDYTVITDQWFRSNIPPQYFQNVHQFTDGLVPFPASPLLQRISLLPVFYLFLAYLGISFLLALFSFRKKISFLGLFFLSVLLTPVIGFLALLFSKRKQKSATH